MIVDGAPLQRIIWLEAPGVGTIVVVELEDMVQPERHHVIHASLAAGHHHFGHRVHKGFVPGEGQLQPLARYGLSRETRIPGQTAEGVPVGLREVVAAPVVVQAHIGHTGNAAQALRADKGEELLPHRSQIDQVARLPQVFLRNL